MPYTLFILAQIPSSDQGFSSIKLLLLGAGIIGISIIMRSTAKRVRESREPGSPARQRYAKMTQEITAKRDLEAIMVELDELARQIHGRIDTKFAKLESIIRDADERIERLSKLADTPRQPSALDITVGDNEPDGPSKPAQPRPASSDQPPHMHEEIYRLADAGVSAVDIAAKVSRMTGEIELILSLRKTQMQASASATQL